MSKRRILSCLGREWSAKAEQWAADKAKAGQERQAAREESERQWTTSLNALQQTAAAQLADERQVSATCKEEAKKATQALQAAEASWAKVCHPELPTLRTYWLVEEATSPVLLELHLLWSDARQSG